MTTPFLQCNMIIRIRCDTALVAVGRLRYILCSGLYSGNFIGVEPYLKKHDYFVLCGLL